MANAVQKAEKQLREITKCPICMNAFTDPRILPCIHTFCFECLTRIVEGAELKPGDKMPCPICRKELTISADGVKSVQKNFFMENLFQFKTTLQVGHVAVICDICSASDEGKTGEIATATMRCLECQDNYCDCCLKVHKFQKLSTNHQVVPIGSDATSGMKRSFTVKYCTKHTQKPLDYYCADCKKIVCVSCFVESHKLHDCKDITSVEEEFRQRIEKNASKISNYADKCFSMRNKTEKRKADFLTEIAEAEKEIHKRNQELKSIIDVHTQSLLDDLSVAKSNHLKEMVNEMEEIERCCTILSSFEAYCTELRLKGSASDICSSVDQLIARADELEKDHEEFISRPHRSVEVSFDSTDLREVLEKSNTNVVGQIKDTTTQFENYAVVVRMSDGTGIKRDVARDVIKVNLHRPNEISELRRIPVAMQKVTTVTVYCNTMYVTGIGDNADEIWKYNQASGWMICTSLVEGRRRHSAAFIDEVLYICGGISDFDESVLDSIEAYNAVTDKCTTAGKLVQCVQNSGNCVPFRSSLFIFGGSDEENNPYSLVQVYNTKENTCSLLSTQMPRPSRLMRAALWETSVMLLGRDTCFIFNFESETWQEREQFKTDVVHFGLVLVNERIFVLGGGVEEVDKYDERKWKCRDDVRYISVRDIVEDKPVDWKVHGKLPTPSLVHACVKMQFQSSNRC